MVEASRSNVATHGPKQLAPKVALSVLTLPRTSIAVATPTACTSCTSNVPPSASPVGYAVPSLPDVSPRSHSRPKLYGGRPTRLISGWDTCSSETFSLSVRSASLRKQSHIRTAAAATSQLLLANPACAFHAAQQRHATAAEARGSIKRGSHSASVR